MDPAPFLRGNAFPGSEKVPYPRALLEDAQRLPMDTWMQASIPVGVRLEIAGDASGVEITYRTATEKLGYRGDGAGKTFALWRFLKPVAEEPAVFGDGTLRLDMGEASDHRAIVYLPEGMKPTILGIEPIGGSIEPAGARRRWVCYGDSIAEGWIASGPALTWPAIAARECGLDVVNMGYAGAARGEIVSAEEIATIDADVISINHGTNCWTRIPHSIDQFKANLHAFIDVLRQGHPTTPVVVASPIIRPDAESKPNRFGATLVDLRAAMEHVVLERKQTDTQLHLIEGLPLVTEGHLGDGIHPNDDGHAAIARAVGPIVAELAGAD